MPKDGRTRLSVLVSMNDKAERTCHLLIEITQTDRKHHPGYTKYTNNNQNIEISIKGSKANSNVES